MGVENKKEIQRLLLELEDLEGYISDFWSFLPLPILYLNNLHLVLDVNSVFLEFSRYKEINEVSGKDIEIFFKEKDQVNEIKKEILKEGKIWEKEAIFFTKDREEKEVTIFALVRRDKEKNLIGYFLAVVDISKPKAIQKELQERVEELEKFRKVAVGRELRIAELKEEVAKLKEELQKYKELNK